MIPSTPSVSPSSVPPSSGTPPHSSVPLWKRFIARRESARDTAPSPSLAVVHETEPSVEEQVQAREAELIVAVFRTLVVLVAIFAPRLLGLSGSYEMPEVWLAALAGLYNIITGLSCLRPGSYGLRRSFIVVMDMMLITLWMRLSGQWELFPFYYLVVVVAAMWFRVLGGALAAAFCMAEEFVKHGANCIFGDFLFILDLPIRLTKLSQIKTLGALILPIACRLPFKMLYPTGDKQTQIISNAKQAAWMDDAEIIAGDFLLIRRYLPENLSGKTLITNTTTPGDVELLKARGLSTLITTTPEFEGRSFGTNVMEGVFVALGAKTPAEYSALLKQLNWKPRVVNF